MINDLPKAIFEAMVDRGALIPGSDDRSFEINFYIVQKEFPSYLELVVENSLNDIERWAYLEGYMAFKVLENGLLEWHVTNRRFNG